MHAVKSKYWAKGEKLLKLNFVDCDGGDQKSETSGYLQPRELINYDSSNYTSDCKLSLLLQYEIIYIGHNITRIVVLFLDLSLCKSYPFIDIRQITPNFGQYTSNE